jgi:hypothetical protein
VFLEHGPSGGVYNDKRRLSRARPDPVAAAFSLTAACGGNAGKSTARLVSAPLDDNGEKWTKFSKQELSDLKDNDDLVTQVVAKYGLDKDAAQRDVAALMKGRTF